MDQRSTATSPSNGASTPHELFALSDEQILEIEPQQEVANDPSRLGVNEWRVAGEIRPAVISSEARTSSLGAPLAPRNLSAPDATDATAGSKRDSSSRVAPRNDSLQGGSVDTAFANQQAMSQGAQAGVPVPPEPPGWLAAQMKDPWSGEEARELWNGVVQARQEAAAYRAAFATPEDARALKELYPGGVYEARATARRAQILDDIDRAYFGAPDTSPEQLSAARAQLAATMLREDPAAFREMVFAGLRALEEAEKGSVGTVSASNLPRLAQVFAANRNDVHVAPPFRAASSPAGNITEVSGSSAGLPVRASTATQPSDVGARHASSVPEERPAPHRGLPAQAGNVSADEAHLASYAAFEKAANEDLERSVGAAISRTLEQALPNLQGSSGQGDAGARHGVPLRESLGLAVRQDVEAALKGDRQLGEQIVEILSARRFDNETRPQVVRLIDDRARQLVPSAAKRVINDWTQTTLVAHRGSAARADAASARREVEPAGSLSGMAAASINSPRAAFARPASDSRRLDYRKLSDEQILNL